jgi:hypothetical protein
VHDSSSEYLLLDWIDNPAMTLRWKPFVVLCALLELVEKVRALSGGEGSLIDTGGVSMMATKSSHVKRDESLAKFQVTC